MISGMFISIWISCTHLIDLCNGDRLQFTENRGVGMYYVLWLLKGSYIDKFQEAAAKRYSTLLEDLTDDDKFISCKAPVGKVSHAFPCLASRNSPGFPNKEDFECYLFVHPDEFGYAPPTVMCTAPLDYFCGEFRSGMVDPLLTHSECANGEVVANAKAQEEWKENPSFPHQYIGQFDENDNCDGAYSWKRIENASEYFEDNKPSFLLTRLVMAKHFQLALNVTDIAK